MTEPLLVDFYPEFYNEPKSEVKACDKLEFQKCRRFGVGYMGSKNQIVKKLMPQLPSAKYFIDLFAGGCAMTHGAMLSGKYERFIANDIGDAPSLFLRAIKGEFKDEKRWISRDDFQKLKDSDPYIRYCWSFGNKGEGYMYAEVIEPYKKAYYYARRFNDFSLFDEFAPYIKAEFGDNLRSYIAKNTGKIKQDYIRWYLKTQLKIKGDELQKSGLTQSAVDKHLGTQMSGHYFGRSQWQFPTLEYYNKLKEILPLEKSYFECVNFLNALSISLQRLESLQSLQSLESLESLQSLEVYQGCYKELKLPKANECVIYCDPPYFNCEGYHKQTLKNGKTSFNHGEFYDYVESLARQGYKVFISEYDMPKDRFKSIFNVEKRQQLNGKGARAIKQEHLFVPII